MRVEKFALFDFDDTLLKHDSMGHLYVYYMKRNPLKIYRGLILGVKAILYKLKLIPFQVVKEELIYPISQMSDEQLKDFYVDNLIPRYYPNVLAQMKKHVAEGYHVWLVSASPEPYLFCTDLPVEVILGTKVERKGDRWTNHIISKNCKRDEKVNRINEVLKEKNLAIDYENSYGYSDSDSDIPMLELVKNKVRINKKNGEMSPFIKGQ